jgi:hypothetical protein
VHSIVWRLLSAARLDEHEGDVIGEHELVDVLSP